MEYRARHTVEQSFVKFLEICIYKCRLDFERDILTSGIELSV